MTDNRITVTGHAQQGIAPTVAAWHLTIQATDADARVAYERCAEQSGAVVERLRTAAEIETQRITAEPAHDHDADRRRQVRHEASTTVSARVPVEHLRASATPSMPIEVPDIQVRESVTVVFALID